MAHNIIALCLPTHSTYLVQPLDVGIFSAYKRRYSVAVNDATRDGITGINKTNFIDLLHRARTQTFSRPESIINSWRGAGLIPF